MVEEVLLHRMMGAVEIFEDAVVCLRHQLSYPWLPTHRLLPALKKCNFHINCFGRPPPHLTRCNSLTHSSAFLIWAPLFVHQISPLLSFWFNAHHLYGLKEYNSNWRTFRNCIFIRIRENPTVFQFCEVFQCLQEDVFKLEKANYLSFKSWRWHGAHIFASRGLASPEWILNFRGKIFSGPKQSTVHAVACARFVAVARSFCPREGICPYFFAAWGNLGVFRGK